MAKVYLTLGDAKEGAAYFLQSNQLPGNPSQYWEYSNYLFALQHNNIAQHELFDIIKNYDKMFNNIKMYKHKTKKIMIKYELAIFRQIIAME